VVRMEVAKLLLQIAAVVLQIISIWLNRKK
jgi:hypothetical protein